MKKYKVEVIQKDTYIVDVLAKDEAEAKEKATDKWNEIAKSGTHHYHQIGDTENDFGSIYDVSDTEDEFNP
jgi:hypothetical protein